MADTEIIADLSPSASQSDFPATYNDLKDKRHWTNITAVTDTTLDLEVTHDHHTIVISAATLAAGINLPPSDSSSAGQSFYYYVADATNTVTIARDGSDTINGAGADPTFAVNARGQFISLGDGNWMHFN